MIYPRFQKQPVSDRSNQSNKEIVNEIGLECIFVPRDRVAFGQHQESRLLARAKELSVLIAF